MPFLAEDSPSNHSYRRLGSIINNRVLLQAYDKILLLTDYRVTPTLFGQYDPVPLSRNLTITSANFTIQGYRLLEVCRMRWPQHTAAANDSAALCPELCQRLHGRRVLHPADLPPRARL